MPSSPSKTHNAAARPSLAKSMDTSFSQLAEKALEPESCLKPGEASVEPVGAPVKSGMDPVEFGEAPEASEVLSGFRALVWL